MRLAIEITTCTPSRTGVGYYTEHLIDALLETRKAGDEVVLVSNRQPDPKLGQRWAPHLHVRGPGIRALWMQTTVPRILADAGVDVAVFPNYVVPLASPCPTLVVVHDLAILRMPQHFTLRKRLLMEPMLRQSVAAASVVASVSEASQRDITALLGVPRERMALLPGAAHPSCRPAPPEVVAAVRARHGSSAPTC